MQLPLLSSHEVCLDLGSSVTKVKFEQKVLWQQPTCLAVYTQGQSVISIGDSALDLVGKEPVGVEVWFPICQGEITDYNKAQIYLKALTTSLFSHPSRRWGKRHHWRIHEPVGSTTVTKRLLRQVGKESLGSAVLVSTSNAVQSLIAQELLPNSGVLIVLGAQTTYLFVFAQGKVLQNESIQWGVDEIQAVMSQVLLEQLQLVASHATLREMQTKLAGVHLSGKEADQTLVIQVKSLKTQVSSAHIVTARQFAPQILAALSDVLIWIKSCLIEVQGEVHNSLLSQGIWLAGGGAQLPGLLEVISEQTQCPVQVMSEPQLALLRGLSNQQD